MGWFTSIRKEITADVATKCTGCEEAVFNKDLQGNLHVCPHCEKHLRMPVNARIEVLCDEGAFAEFDADVQPSDPLGFSDSKAYPERLEAAQNKTKAKEAIVTGVASICGHKTVLGVMNFEFIGGSMGSVVGEKISRAAQKAIDLQLPLILFSTSGGARMQEGILSLMQMVKTGQAVAKMAEKRLPYISVLTDPTTGGVTASFAMLGDIIIAEPKALIGFAGPRVIEQTIRETLPEGFQTSEFLLDKGVIDMIVPRNQMRGTLGQVLSFFKEKDGNYYVAS